MKFEAARVDSGEKVLTQPRDQNRQRSETRDEETRKEQGPVMKNKPEKPVISLAKSVKTNLETVLQVD
jgi:hypothetical protein